MHVEALGTQFFVSTSPTNPKAEDETQIKRLSELRNKAPEPPQSQRRYWPYQ